MNLSPISFNLPMHLILRLGKDLDRDVASAPQSLGVTRVHFGSAARRRLFDLYAAEPENAGAD
jgi:hypothetical protein